MILKILKDKHCMLIILVLIILHQKKDGFDIEIPEDFKNLIRIIA